MAQTDLAVMRMLENLMSPEYSSGQMDNPEGFEEEIPDPFAQFSAVNDGILASAPKKRRKPGRPANKQLVKQLLETLVKPQGFVPEDRERMSPAIPFNPSGPVSNVDQMTMLRGEQDTADRKLTESSNRLALPMQLLSLASPMAGRGMMQQRPGTLALPKPSPQPNPAMPTPPQMQPNGPMTPNISPMLPGSGLIPRGDAHKFSSKGGKQFINRQNAAPSSEMDAIKDATKWLKEKFYSKPKENPFDKPLSRETIGKNRDAFESGLNPLLRELRGEAPKKRTTTKGKKKSGLTEGLQELFNSVYPPGSF
jgi:hypothetical protein